MILYEYSYLRVYTKIVKFSFSTYLTPLAYMFSISRPPDTIARKIWALNGALNSQQNEFDSQNRVCAQHTNFRVFAQARVDMSNSFYWEFAPHISAVN